MRILACITKDIASTRRNEFLKCCSSKSISYLRTKIVSGASQLQPLGSQLHLQFKCTPQTVIVLSVILSKICPVLILYCKVTYLVLPLLVKYWLSYIPTVTCLMLCSSANSLRVSTFSTVFRALSPMFTAVSGTQEALNRYLLKIEAK